MDKVSNLSFRRVFVDLNTQCDYLLPNGALPVSNRSEAITNIHRLMLWARRQKSPVISSLDAHRPGERYGGLPARCVDRTPGQKKLPFTLLPRRILIQADNTLNLPFDPFRRYQQVILTKRTADFMSNPKADRLITDLRARCWVVFGVLTELCIKAAVLGLITRQKRVVVAADACGHWSQNEAELALRQMEAKGALIVTTEDVINGKAEEQVRILIAATALAAKEKEAASAVRHGIALHSVHGEKPLNGANPSNGVNPLNAARPVNEAKPLNGAKPVSGAKPTNGRMAPDLSCAASQPTPEEAAPRPSRGELTHAKANKTPPLAKPGAPRPRKP